jgi:hypothetical protein
LSDSIIGHGWRRKQAHDDSHDWIKYHRGLCKVGKHTLSFLPAFSLPYTHYSLVARSQALRRRFVEHRDRTHCGLEKQTPEKRNRCSGRGKVVAWPRVGGLHYRYERAA